MTSYSILRKITNGDAVSSEEFYTSCHSLIWLCGRNFGLNQQEQLQLMAKVINEFFNTGKIFVYNGPHGRFRDYFRQMIYQNAKEIIAQHSDAGKMWLESRIQPEKSDKNKGSRK